MIWFRVRVWQTSGEPLAIQRKTQATRWLSWYGVGLASADRLPVVVRIPAGPIGSLKCDPPKGNGRRPQKKLAIQRKTRWSAAQGQLGCLSNQTLCISGFVRRFSGYLDAEFRSKLFLSLFQSLLLDSKRFRIDNFKKALPSLKYI